ncbi:MAG TPA: ABC transporter substrate-binding protein [Chloroflexota bacterium]|nr:ABC transporter substrate-binding protein [Chloroflexota bacterium]
MSQAKGTPSSSANGAAAAKPAASAPAGAAPRYGGGDPNGYPIRIAYASPAVASWPFYAALSQGFFAQQHLAISMIQMAGSVAITGLSKGDIDFTNAPSNAIEGASRGLPFKMVLSSWDRTPWTISGKAELKSIQDLKGKRVGTNQVGSSPYLYLQAALKRAGMSMADIKVVSSPGTQDTFTLLLAGQLDAAVVSPPFDAIAEDKGFHQVAFIGDALQQPYIGLGTSATFIAQHRPQVVATIKALMDANRWLKANPDGAANLIVKNLATSPAVAKRVTTRMLPLLSVTGELPLASVQEAIAIQQNLTHATITTKAQDMVDWTPLHEALGKS